MAAGKRKETQAAAMTCRDALPLSLLDKLHVSREDSGT